MTSGVSACQCIVIGAERFAHPACKAFHTLKAVGFVTPDGKTQRGSWAPRTDVEIPFSPEEATTKDAPAAMGSTESPRAATCRVPNPTTGEECGKMATHRVTFHDGDRVRACIQCTLTLRQLAEASGAAFKAERL